MSANLKQRAKWLDQKDDINSNTDTCQNDAYIEDDLNDPKRPSMMIVSSLGYLGCESESNSDLESPTKENGYISHDEFIKQDLENGQDSNPPARRKRRAIRKSARRRATINDRSCDQD